MPVSELERARFLREYRRLVAEAKAAGDAAVAGAAAVVDRALLELAARFARLPPESFAEEFIPVLLAEIEEVAVAMGVELDAHTVASLRAVGLLGARLPVAALAGAGISVGYDPVVSPTLINLATDYSSGLIVRVSDQLRTNVGQWVADRAVAPVAGRTKLEVIDAIEAALNDEGAERFVFRSIRHRAEAIERTETGRLLQTAKRISGEQLGRGALLHGWDAITYDGRARATHLEADARYYDHPIPLEDDFVVGGIRMPHPLYPGAPAREVVRCRCDETQHLSRAFQAPERPALSQTEAQLPQLYDALTAETFGEAPLRRAA